jgi:hypothetical protein
LQVLKLIHERVVDTAALFPHPSGLPYKHALKKLAKEFLRKDIQDGKGTERLRVQLSNAVRWWLASQPFPSVTHEIDLTPAAIIVIFYLYLFPHIFCSFTEGHDSVQDAAVALELALLKASAPREVARVLPWGDDPVPKYSLFEALLTQVRWRVYAR